MIDALTQLESAIIREPAVISSDAKLCDAIAKIIGVTDLSEMHQVGHSAPPDDAGSSYLVIVDSDQVVGLFTERDAVRLAAQQLSLDRLTMTEALGERLTKPPITVRESTLTDLDTVLSLFDQYSLSHLPILDDTARLAGVISRDSLQVLLRSMVSKKGTSDKTEAERLASPHQTKTHQTKTHQTETHQTETRFYEEDRSYAPLLDILPVGIAHTDLEGVLTYVSERYGEIVGIAPESLVGQSWRTGHSPELIERMTLEYEQAQLENRPWRLEYQLAHAGGLNPWVYGQAVVTHDTAGQAIGYVTAITDISDRKRAESLLEEQYKILEKIAKAEPLEDIFLALLKAMEKYLPETVCSIMFCQDGELVNALAPSLPPTYVEAVNAAYFPIAEGACNCGTAAYRRDIVIVKDIATDPLWRDYKHLALPHGVKACFSIPIFDENQEVLGVFGIYAREIRAPRNQEIEFGKKLASLAGIAIERSQVSQALKRLNQELETRVEERTAALKASEERWQLALKGAKDGIWDWNPQTNQIFLSQRLKEIRGFNDETLSDTWEGCLQLIHPEDRDNVSQAIEAHFAGKSEFFELEYRVKHRKGHYIWILSRAQAQRDALGRAVRMIGSETDITQRKMAEQALILKQNHLEALLDNIPHMAWIKDEQSRFIAVNKPFAQASGRAAEELTGKTDLHIWPPDLAQSYRQDDFQVLHSGQRKVVEEHVARADGTLGWLETTKTPFKDANGNFAGTVGIAADMTDRKRMEAALAESEAKYRRLVEGGQDLIWSTDDQGRFTYLSPQFKALTGWDASEWIGKLCIETVHSGDQDRVVVFQQALVRERVSGTVEFRHAHQDKSYRWVSMSANPVFNDAGEWIGQQGTLTNITERKTAELALQESQEYLRRLTENIPGMIFRYVLHPDGQNEFTYVSPYSRELYELEPEEILFHEKSPWDIVHPDDVDRLAATIQHSADKLQPLVVEHRFITPTRGLRWGQNIARPHREENGDVVWDGVSFDITDRKTAELAFQASESKFQRITESVPGVIFQYVLHPDGRDECTYISPHVQQLHELEPDAVLQDIQLLWDVIHPDDVLHVSEAVRVSAAFLQPFSTEMRLRFPKGKIKWVQIFSQPEQCENGDIVWDGVIVDVSDRKQAEEALQVLSSRLKFALESAEIGIWEWNSKNDTLTWDERTCALYGIAPEAFSGEYEDWLQLLHPEDRARVKMQEEMAIREQGSVTTEFRIVRPDGEARFIHSNVATLRTEQGEVVGTIGLDRDITERKQAEIALQDSQTQFRRMTENVPGMIYRYVLHPDGTDELSYVSSRILEVFEVAPEVALQNADAIWARIHPDDLCLVQDALKDATLSPQSLTIDYRLVLPDKGLRWVQNRAYTEKLSNGDVIWDGVILDNTEQKQAEMALEREALRRAAVFNASSDGIHILDRSGNLLEANEGFAQMLGYSLDEVSQLNVADWDAQWSDDELQDIFQNYDHTYLTLETLHRRKDGSVFPVEIAECSMEWNGEFALVCIARDISERKRAELELKRTNQELARATRLKDEFLANMSHELRTPLNAILGMTEGLQDEVFGQINNQQLKSLDTIEQSGLHLLDLINEILDLAKIESGNIELVYSRVSVTRLCEFSLTFVKKQSLEKNIQLRLKIPLHLPDIRVDERRIRQVLINLLNNAVKFTSPGGNITLEVMPIPDDTSAQSYLRLVVTDTGIGMSPDEMTQLFQPFVQIDSALNRQYEGTGLGLVLVKRIVELHGGHVAVTSEVGVGSCFTIDLPYDSAAQPVTHLPPASSEASASQSVLE